MATRHDYYFSFFVVPLSVVAHGDVFLLHPQARRINEKNVKRHGLAIKKEETEMT